ncbi:MAG: 4-alpha-glucanotransferase [Anaerolineae bacterium]|nr:4-alpha-glucanotransferase [Thermoflexales bacterium]MDW8407766.1 4-alpha-glucanotransferase [Anaerolineae bacterium]
MDRDGIIAVRDWFIMLGMERASGLLLHPTSLPGRFGIGELGKQVYEFIDFLAAAGQRLWQVLPLGPTGYGDSPYQCFSAFAGNPLLISLDTLVEEGALSPADVANAPPFPAQRVDYGPVIQFKFDRLRRSFDYFQRHAAPEDRAAFEAFCAANAGWLDDYALFMAIKEAHGGRVWSIWERDIARREPAALARCQAQLRREQRIWQYTQYQFFKQWRAVREYAHAHGIEIIGDIPIFVAYDSADAWANREQFYFDEDGAPTVIAGVPPDYFSPTGQRWGNPLYRWDVMQQHGFDWWIARCHSAFTLYDRVRIDHFRGFEAYWEVPADEPTAIKGRWVKAPGYELFRAIEQALRPADAPAGYRLPIIAEDLGVITPEVEALRDTFGFPGMRVLQFAFVADTKSAYLPHNYIRNCVAYSGTHDNNTTVGWFNSLDERTRKQVLSYTGTDGRQIHWALARLLMMSVADTIVLTMQDVLGLGEEARMNLPGRPDGNWQWRLLPGQLTDELAGRLREMAVAYGRFDESGPQ